MDIQKAVALGSEASVKALEGWIDLLYNEAESIVEDHWQFVYRMDSEAKSWKDKSCLSLRLRRVGNSINIEWSRIEWWGSKARGTRKTFRRHISKPKDAYGYTLSKLITWARDWEKDRVEATERKLAEIRRVARHVVKAIAAVNAANNAEAKREV